jgi:hypothetical protein
MNTALEPSDIEAIQDAWRKASGDPGAAPAERAIKRLVADWPAERVVRAIHIGWRIHRLALKRWKDGGKGAMPKVTLASVRDLCVQNLDELERDDAPRSAAPRGHAPDAVNPLADPAYLDACRTAAVEAEYNSAARWEPARTLQAVIGAFAAVAGAPPWLYDRAVYWAGMEAANVRQPLTAGRAVEIGTQRAREYLGRGESHAGTNPQKGREA